MQDLLIDEKELRQLVGSRLTAAGLNSIHAEKVADVLVHADLRGVRSHGVIRTEHYVKRLHAGSLNRNPKFSFEKIKSGAGLFDADDGMGHPACDLAMGECIRLAKDAGIGMVGVHNSSHCGAMSYYVLQAVNRGLIGIAITHTDKLVAPYGSSKPFFGTNPIAFGFPTKKHQPVVLDMATSYTAYGKILHAAQSGKSIPDDWGFDGKGQPTTDPNKIESVTPFGQYKGYGIGMAIDVLTGVLLGAQFGPHITAMYGDYDKPRKLASTMIAIDPEIYAGLDRFTSQMDLMVDEIHALPPAPGFDSVLIAGDNEWENEKRNRAQGVPVLESIYAFLKQR